MVFRSKIVYKLIAIILLTAVLPAGFTLYIFIHNFYKINDFVAVQINEATTKLQILVATNVNELAENLIKNKAIDIARQVEVYLSARPKVKLDEMRKDTVLRSIAVQKFGQSGYTALHNNDAVSIFHINPAVESTNLTDLFATLPGLADIISSSLTGDGKGYYKWKDEQGETRDKYMYCRNFYENELVICATIYLDEFYTAANKINNSTGLVMDMINDENKKMIDRMAFVLSIVGLFLVIAALSMGIFAINNLVKPLAKLKESVKLLSSGRLNEPIKIISHDEIGELSQAFNQMAFDLKKANNEMTKYSHDLELKIEDKTKELRSVLEKIKKDKDDADDQRIATLNILEDIHESEQQLQDMNLALEKSGKQLMYLKQYSDELFDIMNTREAVAATWKYIHLATDYDLVIFALLMPFEENDPVYETYSRSNRSSEKIEQAGIGLEPFCNIRDNREGYSICKIINSTKPKIHYDTTAGKEKKDFIGSRIYKINTANNDYGILYAACDKEVTGDDDEKFIEAIVVSLAMFLDRMAALNTAHNSRTASLIESLSDGIVLLDPNKNLLLLNAAFTNFTGIKSEKFKIENFTKLFPGQELKKLIDQAVNQNRIGKILKVFVNAVCFEIVVTPVHDHLGKVVAVAILMHDITTIEEIDRMKTEFVSVASHQLRTPLTAIKLFTEMLAGEQVGKLTHEQKEYLDNVGQSIERMIRLVNDLLNVTRIESGRLQVNPEPAKIDEQLKMIIADTSVMAGEKNIKVVFDNRAKDLPTIMTDVGLFRQVFQNLVTNAIRYSKNGTNVKIRLEKESENSFKISVRDEGIGIPEKSRHQVFEKFFRANNAVKAATDGTGLGLYVSKMIVESQAGRIWFESKIDQGTTFFVSLPVSGMIRKEGERGLAIS